LGVIVGYLSIKKKRKEKNYSYIIAFLVKMKIFIFMKISLIIYHTYLGTTNDIMAGTKFCIWSGENTVPCEWESLVITNGIRIFWF
jgi:hypothetical protein